MPTNDDAMDGGADGSRASELPRPVQMPRGVLELIERGPKQTVEFTQLRMNSPEAVSVRYSNSRPDEDSIDRDNVRFEHARLDYMISNRYLVRSLSRDWTAAATPGHRFGMVDYHQGLTERV